MNKLWEESDDKDGSIIISYKKKKEVMKLVFINNTEKEKATSAIMNASSATNSKVLMDLVKDSFVDGSEPEPTVAKEPETVPEQESMQDLINRAQSMGVVVTMDDSRAGILQKIEEASNSKPEETKKEVEMKTFKVIAEEGIILNGSTDVIELDGMYEADPESDETVRFLEAGAIEEVVNS